MLPENYTAPFGMLNALRVALGFIIINAILGSRFWRVLPEGHPTRIFMDGRARTMDVARKTIAPRCAMTWALVLAAAALVIGGLVVVDATTHTLALDPFEGIFNSKEPNVKPIDIHHLTVFKRRK